MRTPAWTDRVLWRRNQIAGQVASMHDDNDEELGEGNIDVFFSTFTFLKTKNKSIVRNCEI